MSEWTFCHTCTREVVYGSVPLNELDAIALGQTELVWTSRDKVMDNKQNTASDRAAGAISTGGHCVSALALGRAGL